MASAAQILMFNAGCCGGAGSCAAVSINGSQANYVIPISSAVLGIIRITHTLNGDSPFEIFDFTTEFDFLTFQLSGNTLYISIDTTLTTVFETNVAYPVSYSIRNCGGAGLITYNGTITITS